MAQPAQIAVEVSSQIGNAVFQRGQPVETHAEGKAPDTCPDQVRLQRSP